ncbi:hypothetical protein [Sphingomonas sp. SORGH_AS_0879]|uniref:hypothetical protein n=1 Tax=Sphingomonas sp. SORGH_AS_0879 TaxID=3041790 RepID=UPI00278969D9|nr:hypothetical protein [Sphingomonas sp. SORGH_AS_0879]MDQ1229710.1 hypothetical protein [Sphingomonas sp. SORGH_AS_0879]
MTKGRSRQRTGRETAQAFSKSIEKRELKGILEIISASVLGKLTHPSTMSADKISAWVDHQAGLGRQGLGLLPEQIFIYAPDRHVADSGNGIVGAQRTVRIC